jgi:signal transduction histidine kinase
MAVERGCPDTSGVAVDVDPIPSRLEQLELGRLALLGRLARGMVHELNNPLFVVLALTELMARSAEPGSQGADRLAQMHESGVEMRGLVAAIGDLARTPVETPAGPVHVVPAVQECVDLIRRITLRKDIELVERYEADPVVAICPGELRLAILGLLADAQDGTPEDGRIDVIVTTRGGRAVVTVRWQGVNGAGGLEPLDAILRSVIERGGGSVRVGAGAVGGREAALTLPVAIES